MSEFTVVDVKNTKVGDVVVYAGFRSDAVGWAYLVSRIEIRENKRYFILFPVVHTKRTFENETGDQGPALRPIPVTNGSLVKAEIEAKHVDEERRPFEVCSRCQGNGTHANPAFDGMTGDEMEEMGEERYEFLEQYTTRGGMYDVNCEVCKGQRVVRGACKCFECVGTQLIIEEDEAQRRAEIAAGC
jgi:hypothetical protein